MISYDTWEMPPNWGGGVGNIEVLLNTNAPGEENFCIHCIQEAEGGIQVSTWIHDGNTWKGSLQDFIDLFTKHKE